jgi:uncharacterized Zn finger protein (UPF0148 family)
VSFGCPSCGAPFQPAGEGKCGACGQAVEDGRFDWQVARVEVRREDVRAHSLTGTSAEVGTDAATAFAPFIARRWRELTEADPAISVESLQAHLASVFHALNRAWAAQDLRPIRPFVSDRLYAYLQYWVDAYKEQGLRNEVASPRLLRSVAARVERDSHFESVVLRLWAAGMDFTEEVKTGRVVGGSRTEERSYSEYWTLIRSARVRGAPRADKKCPACGAPLDVNQAGCCAHCGVHVTSGEFDWVLSKIEQDESYRA